MKSSKSYYQTLARGLELVRKEMELNKQEFAKLNGIDRRTYSNWIDDSENPRLKPPPERLEQIAKATGRSIGDFFPSAEKTITSKEVLDKVCDLLGYEYPKKKPQAPLVYSEKISGDEGFQNYVGRLFKMYMEAESKEDLLKLMNTSALMLEKDSQKKKKRTARSKAVND